MTVLVGIRCKDGVVIGSDSSATFGTATGVTIEQPTRKIEVIDGALIVAGTGQMGLGQRFCAQLETMHKSGPANAKCYIGKSAVEAGKMMASAAISDFASTDARKGSYGALVAFCTRKELHLCEFASTDLQPELKTDHLWYASMGSGQAIADPFLALMRKVFWTDGMPSLADGIFAAAWTLQHTIDINPGGVNGPVRLATLTWADGTPNSKAVARFLTEEEIGQHMESVESAERHLASFRDLLSGDSGQVPEVPVPAARNGS
jgi:hypothetical protein